MAKIDWDIVTSYIDHVGTTLKTVSFTKSQDTVKVSNIGNVNLTYTIGTKTGTLSPNSSITVNETISSFTIKAVSGTCSFEVWATEAGTEKDETPPVLPDDVAGEIASINASLAQKAAKDEIFSMANMGQDIKTAMTGGSVAVVDKDAVLEENIVNKQVTPKKTSFFNVLMTNFFNKTDITTGKALNYATGALYNNASYATTGFIEITPETLYTFSHSTENRVYYDVNKTMISGEFSPVTSITTPANARYIRFMVLIIRLDIFMFVEGSTLPSVYYPFGKQLVTYNNIQFADDVFNYFPALPTSRSKLFGKKWNALGDSITYGAYTTKSYHQYISEKTGCVVTNYGISNSTVSTVNGKGYEPMVNRYMNMADDADIITILGGVNDAGYGSADLIMGDINSTDPATFYGAYNLILDGLIKKYPTKLIATFTPMKADDGYRPKLGEIATAVKEVSAKYGVPCLDLYNMSGISLIDEQQALIQPDNLHPNAEGHRIIAGKILSFLESLMPIEIA